MINNIILVTHATEVFGSPGALMEYLKLRTKKFIYIAHPLDKTVKLQSTASIYQQGKLINQKTLPAVFNWLGYLKDFLATIWWGLTLNQGQTVDYYIGANNFNCLAGFVLRYLIKIKKVVFYTLDYSPIRFHQKVLDWLYRRIDRFALRRANFVWSSNQRVAGVRQRQGLPDSKSLLVPNGVYLKSIPRARRKVCPELIKFVFQGHLTKAKGALELIVALEAVNRQYQNWHLAIIGSGPFESDLRRIAARKGLNNKIKFFGRLPNKRVLKEMVKYDVGIALYNEVDSYTCYCDPLKVKEYLACGLSVLMTDVPYLAKIVNQKDLGLVIEPRNQWQLQQALIRLITKRKRLHGYQSNARRLARDFDWPVIFDKAFSQMEAVE